ncbi:hypothetical protein ABG768_018544 [Culter alburnus]|uniref:GOLD domain-containing protein n=1 Tax=Culter alburnus TaxID=194366 RepID=A0AAW1YVY5_CULAL
MCFSNFHSRFGIMQVFLNFGQSSIRLQKFVFLMWRHYNYERMRRGADFYLLQSNSTYVNIWTAVQSLVIITAGHLQLCFLKRLFKSKPAEGDKPRC